MDTTTEVSRSWLPWVRRGAIAVILVAVGYTVIDVVEQVNWPAVGRALSQIRWWQLVALFVLLVVKQVLNASPLSYFIGGLSLVRATLNDQAGTLVAMVAPPPTDFVLRLRIFASWGIERGRALAGSIMNVLSFYTNRLLVPMVGLIVLTLNGLVDAGDVVVATVALVLGIALLIGIWLGVHHPAVAEGIGVRSGRVLQRLRPSVDPDGWGGHLARYRGHVAARFRHAFPRSLLSLFAMTLIDASALVVAIRFIGVPSRALPTALIVGGFLLWYPLTILPFSGLGILDAVLLSFFTASSGQVVEARIMAALIVYRVVSLGGTALLGGAALVTWRWTTGPASTWPAPS